ncbi:MAG: arginine-tRNA-protein transferase [Taibaiella sp.]|nr:arginine-tRNA-protein transferase [Taibaiella sp.]
MIEEILLLDVIKGYDLDDYLGIGWYRIGKFIFTTNLLEAPDNSRYNRVFWLRYLVEHVSLSNSNKQIIRKNEQFKISYRRFKLTDELTELHKNYVAGLKFKTAETLSGLLMDVDNDIYDTCVAEVRDEGKLIAAGIFDLGRISIAGIVNFYDHSYSKYSPGKYLMLLKYLFCVKNNIPYYYPGYYSPDYPVFDYKLFIDKAATEVMLPREGAWVSYAEFEKNVNNDPAMFAALYYQL